MNIEVSACLSQAYDTIQKDLDTMTATQQFLFVAAVVAGMAAAQETSMRKNFIEAIALSAQAIVDQVEAEGAEKHD